MTADQSTIRLDIWLWAARFFKTRSLVKEAIARGRVEVNETAAKPAKLVHVGDQLNIRRGDERMGIEVIALDNKRGSATVAQAMYRETEASRAAREAQRDLRRIAGSGFEHPQKRPGKHERRELIDWKEGGR